MSKKQLIYYSYALVILLGLILKRIPDEYYGLFIGITAVSLHILINKYSKSK